ncbi:MAG: protein translocase subunit SecF [Spirochaetaceae bacterium]
MQRVFNFTKLRFVMIALSAAVIIGGIAGTVSQGGLNFGIDFESGLNQRIQIAPVGMRVSYTGDRSASLDIESSSLILELREEEGVEEIVYSFDEYPTMGEIAEQLDSRAGVEAQMEADGSLESSALIAGLNYPGSLGSEPVSVNYRNQDQENYIKIDRVREALSDLGSPQVQVIGDEANQEFQIMVADPSGEEKNRLEEEVVGLLEDIGGENTVVIKRSDYVGPQFAETLAQQSISLVLLALVLILVYIWFRFKFGYAISAIMALIHDVFIVLGFIGVTRLEVSTTTIAAVLTIIGYSLNDTIVVFDRVRENEGLLQGRSYREIINTSITQSLSRTLITSLTTMLAVLALYFFGSGPIKDFALVLIAGIIVGTYSSIYIASPALLGWWNSRHRKQRKKQGLPPKPTEKELEKKIEDIPAAAEGAEGKTAGAQGPGTRTPSAAASRVSNPDEIPAVERKQKGKRKKKKKKS